MTSIILGIMCVFIYFIDNNYKYKLIVLFIILAIMFIVSLLYIIFRINLINKIIKFGEEIEVEIFGSINFPRDKYICYLLSRELSKKYYIEMKVSKKNKDDLNRFLKKGNIIRIMFLRNKPNKIIIKEKYV
jgi:hypothetical protein